MRRRFFNAADNFVGGCYNKLSNEDIKRLGGKRPYVCQFNKIHIHIGPVLKDHDSDVSLVIPVLFSTFPAWKSPLFVMAV